MKCPFKVEESVMKTACGSVDRSVDFGKCDEEECAAWRVIGYEDMEDVMGCMRIHCGFTPSYTMASYTTES